MSRADRLLWACLLASPLNYSTAHAQSVTNYCHTRPVRSEALDEPSKHAWDLFVELNHPATDKTVARGQPDCARSLGAPGTTSVWETWRNAATEVFLPSEPPVWDDISLPDEKPGSVPDRKETPRQDLLRLTQEGPEENQLSFHQLAGLARLSGPTMFFSPVDGVFTNHGGFGETRINRAVYEFIRRNCLYNAQGLQRYSAAITLGRRPEIDLPADAVEVKAAWLDFEKEGISLNNQKTYYAAEYRDRRYGLVSLHIITKDIPFWFWASFHHKDAPANEFEGNDDVGPPKAVQGTVWQNYRLGGTQVSFTTSTGKATLLSDHYVEFGFQRSSCMTCHATAAISVLREMPSAQKKAICSITPNLPAIGLDLAACKKIIGENAFEVGSDKLVTERGPPNPEWYRQDGSVFYNASDFVWSIPFRGYKVQETGQPPARCRW